MTNEKKEQVESVEFEATNKGTDIMNEKKEQVEVKEGFNAAAHFDGFSTRYGWSSSIGEANSREQLRACFADAEAHGLRYVEVELNIEDFNEIWAFLTFSPNPKRGRMPLQMLKDEDNFSDFLKVMVFVNYDLKPINADTERAMKRLYDGERFHDDELHHEASDLASRLDEIARSWIEVLKGSATDEDLQRIKDNSKLETCEMTKWCEIVENILKRENA